MGYGDSIIATATVKRAWERRPGRPIVVGDGTKIDPCPVFENNPRLARTVTPDCVWVREAPGLRPYINYALTNARHTEYDYTFHVEPGELFLTPEETNWPELPKSFVYIEPNVKGSFAGNKDWGFEKWQEVVDGLPDVWFIQGSGRKLVGVEQRDTRSFRHACGLLSHASLFVGTDGGLHHAAAALGKRAVVVWGGLAPPAVLGYDKHVNLCKAKTWCGSHRPCKHCREAMDAVTVAEVSREIQRALA